MLSKKVIKDIQSLGHKKHRSETGLFIAEGPKVVGELLNEIPGMIDHIYATKSWLKENASVQIVTEVTNVELERISQLPTPNAVVCIMKQFSQENPLQLPFTLYLDTIQDPGNLGTIIRIADWFGIQTIICSEGCADQYNPKVVQATMGSISRVRVYYDLNGSWLASQTGEIYAAVLEGESLYDLKPINTGVLLIGNESHGISRDYLKMATRKVTIPKKGKAESLNAAVATGIILSHLLS